MCEQRERKRGGWPVGREGGTTEAARDPRGWDTAV